jgi:hypothetical protein
MRRHFLPLLALPSLFLASCAGPAPYSYRYVPGQTAELHDGYAVAPPNAPAAVHAAIAAGNQIAGSPYVSGGGHGSGPARGFDCSGAASYVLRAAGLIRDSMPSTGFRKFGQSGEGKWISIYARRDHTFLSVAGLRFDTGYNSAGGGNRGPAWTTRGRPTRGCVVRHPGGL